MNRLARAPWPLILAVALAMALLLKWSSGFKDAVVGIAFLSALFLAARRRERFWPRGLGLPLLAYLAAAAWASFNAVQPTVSWGIWAKLLVLTAGFIGIAYLMRAGGRAVLAVKAIAIASAGCALIDTVLWLRCRHLGVQFSTDGRWEGSVFGYPTIAACAHAVGLVLLVALLVRGRGLIARLLPAIGAALCMLILMQLQTRSVLGGIAAGLVVAGLLLLREQPRALMAFAVCGMVLVGVVAATPSLRDRLLEFSGSDRDRLWSDAAHLIGRRPWTGYGYGHGSFLTAQRMLPVEACKYRCSCHVRPPDQDTALQRKNPHSTRRCPHRLDHTHNMMLEQLIQGGVPLLLAWLWLLGASALRVMKAARTLHGERLWALAAVSGALAVLLVYGQFSVFFALIPAFLFWCLLGLLLAVTAPEQKAAEQPPRVTEDVTWRR